MSIKVKVGDVVKAYHQKDHCVVEGEVIELLGERAFVMIPKTGFVKTAFLLEDIREIVKTK